MHTITTKGKSLILVEVPIQSSDYNVYEDELQFLLAQEVISHRDLPQTGLEIIGAIQSGVPDFDVEPYVERINNPYWDKVKNMYLNYRLNPSNTVADYYLSKEDSFNSLLASHSIPYADKKLIILEKK